MPGHLNPPLLFANIPDNFKRSFRSIESNILCDKS